MAKGIKKLMFSSGSFVKILILKSPPRIRTKKSNHEINQIPGCSLGRGGEEGLIAGRSATTHRRCRQRTQPQGVGRKPCEAKTSDRAGHIIRSTTLPDLVILHIDVTRAQLYCHGDARRPIRGPAKMTFGYQPDVYYGQKFIFSIFSPASELLTLELAVVSLVSGSRLDRIISPIRSYPQHHFAPGTRTTTHSCRSPAFCRHSLSMSHPCFQLLSIHFQTGSPFTATMQSPFLTIDMRFIPLKLDTELPRTMFEMRTKEQ